DGGVAGCWASRCSAQPTIAVERSVIDAPIEAAVVESQVMDEWPFWSRRNHASCKLPWTSTKQHSWTNASIMRRRFIMHILRKARAQRRQFPAQFRQRAFKLQQSARLLRLTVA